MNPRSLIQISFLVLLLGCTSTSETIPDFMIGEFQDDYGIEYEISEEIWFHMPNARFHIVEWNVEEQFLIARNDDNNPSNSNQFSRFDWMTFEDSEPWNWGFCMTIYDAETIEIAKNSTPPDRENPRVGCNGFPFSRMQTP